jgi:transposase InsO family protein
MTSQKIKYLHSDNERAEFCNLEFDKFLNECGIQRRLSAPHCPRQNGLAERKNRSLLDKAKCLLLGAKKYQCDTIFNIYAKYFLVVLAMPSDDGQQWPKHVKAIFYIIFSN